jgi:uncharacterized protein (DUF983 family)
MSEQRQTMPTTADVSPYRAALACACPRCGVGRLFKPGLSLELRPACAACGLDYTFVDSGDGPAVFAILILGVVVLGLALLIQFRLEPPLWLLMLVVAPVTLGLSFGLLRPMKSTLIALQFKNKAAEGRLSHD